LSRHAKRLIKVGLPDHLKFFQGHFVSQRDTVGYFHGRPQERPAASGGIQGQYSTNFLSPQITVLKILLKHIIIKKNISPLKMLFSPFTS